MGCVDVAWLVFWHPEMKWPAMFVFLDHWKGRAWLITAVVICYWIFDHGQSPAVIQDQIPVPHVQAGKEVQFELIVQRQVYRRCSMKVYRSLVDANGYARTYGPVQEINADGIRERELRSPGKLLLRLPIPPVMPVGLSEFRTETQFTCDTNPLTLFWPIRETYTWPFVIDPPDPEPKK